MPFDFSPYRAVLLDLDGTLYRAEYPLPGAVELLERLRRQGRLFACLSNTTTSPQRISRRLERMGVGEVDAQHVHTAAYAAIEYVVERFGPRPRAYNLATEGVQEMLDGKVHWVEDDTEPCDAVVVGAAANVYATEQRQRMALSLLRGGAQLVGTSADRVYPSNRGLEFGSGALCAQLAYAANCEPFFCGKPQAIFFHTLCRRLKVKPAQCVLIGDNLETDILGARQLGMGTILPLTGVTRRQDVMDLPPELRPDLVIDDLTAL